MRKYSVYQGISVGTRLALQELIPRYEDREMLTWRNAPYAFAYFLPFLFMAYLVRRANTHHIRMLLVPTVITVSIHCTYRYKLEDSRCSEWIRVLMAYYVVAKALDFGFVRDGRFKIGEKRLAEVNDPDTRGSSENRTRSAAIYRMIPTSLLDALEITSAVRGIGWDFGSGVYIPHDNRPRQRGPFLRATLLELVKDLLIVDLFDSLVKLVPSAGSIEGGSMFLPNVSPLIRYSISTSVHLMGGLIIIFGLSAGNDFFALISVGLLGQSPADWPPLYDSPWRATSLHEFWGKRWHQVLRRTFIILGGYPGYLVAGKAGLILGTFLASGLYHELGLRLSESDHRVTAFFLLQGVGILFEDLWKKISGKRTDGFVGRIWTVFWIIVLGQLCSDAWCMGGIAGATFVPRSLSPVRRLLFPAIRTLVQAFAGRNANQAKA